MTHQAPPSEYDQRLLQITEELCLQLNILNFNPTFVSWEDLDSRSRSGVAFRHDDCLIEKYCVTLSARMKEVLEADEWRPIIASGLIFSKTLRGRRLRETAISLAGFAVLAIILSSVVPIIISALLVIFGTVLVSFILSRKHRSEADRQTLEVVTAEQFLAVLSKIAVAAIQSDGPIPRSGSFSTLTFLPDIQTRIARLKRYSQNPKLRP